MIRRHLPELSAPVASLIEDGIYSLYETRDGRYVLATDAGVLHAVSTTGVIGPVPIEADIRTLNIVAVVFPDRRAQGSDLPAPIAVRTFWERVRTRV